MKRKVIWSLAGCLMVTALVLASCAPASTPTPTPTATPTPTPTGTPTPTTTPGRQEPKYGGTVTYVFESPPTGFDDVFTRPSQNYINNLTNEELIVGNWAKGMSGTKEVTWQNAGMPSMNYMTGCLAESWELPDANTIIWHIRKGIHWQNKPPVNGREFDANDVAAHFKRIVAASTSYVKANHPASKPEDITAPDKWTVVIKCPPGEQGPLFQDLGGQCIIQPPEMVQKYGDMRMWEASCGTGPYALADYISMSSVTLKRNPNYWMKDPVNLQNQLPYPDTVKVLVIPDVSTRVAGLRTGKLDQLRGLKWEDGDSLKKTNPNLKWVYFDSSSDHQVLMWRVDKPELPFKDIRVRQALCMAIDRQAIVKDYYQGNGLIVDFPAAPFKDFGNIWIPIEQLPPAARQVYEYNPEKAKQLLADAGYANGFKTEVVCTDSRAGEVDMLSIFKAYWDKIGVDLTIDVKEFNVWNSIKVGMTYKEMIITTRSWHSPYKFLESRPSSIENLTRSNDPRVEETYKLCAENYWDEAKKEQIYKAFLPYVVEQAWWLEFPPAYQYVFWQPWLKNYNGEFSVGYSNHYDWSKWVWVDQDLKEKMTGTR